MFFPVSALAFTPRLPGFIETAWCGIKETFGGSCGGEPSVFLADESTPVLDVLPVPSTLSADSRSPANAALEPTSSPMIIRETIVREVDDEAILSIRASLARDIASLRNSLSILNSRVDALPTAVVAPATSPALAPFVPSGGGGGSTIISNTYTGFAQEQMNNIARSIAIAGAVPAELPGVRITNATISGGTISGAAISGAIAGATTGTFSGDLATYGVLTVSGAGTSSVSGGFTVGSNTLVIDPAAGRVGIGTSSPSDLLALSGPLYLANAAPAQTANRLYSSSGDLYWAGNLLSSAAVGTWTAAGGDVYRVTGNVGIGTTSPYAKLTVVGETVASHFTATSTSATSTFAGGFQAGGASGLTVTNGRVGVGTNVPGYVLDVQGDIGIGAGFVLRDKDNPSSYYSDLSATSRLNNLQLAGSLSVNATSTLATTTVTGDFSVNSSALVVNGITGNVGIGTTTPTQKLTVYHTTNPAARVESSLFAAELRINNAGGVYLDFGTPSSPASMMTIESAGGMNFIDTRSRNFALVSSQDTIGLNYLYQNGNVGIGTTSPYAKLSVVGETVASHFTATSTTATSTFAGGFQVGGASGLFVTNNGNVGIGTMNASEKLHVAGNQRLTGALYLNASSDYLIRQNGPHLDFSVPDASGGMFRFRDGTAGTIHMVINEVNGYVGIATMTPQNLLDVQGNVGIKNSGYLRLYDTNDAQYASLRLNAGVLSANYPWDFTSSGNHTIAGNVGIGTTSPASKLHVYGGDMRIESSAPLLNFVDTENSDFNIMANIDFLNFRSGSEYLMSLGASGNVGIGTTSPYAKLSVVGETVASHFTATSTSATSTFAGGMIGPNNFTIQQSSGRVAIGTSTITNYPLTIDAGSGGNAITIRTSGGTASWLSGGRLTLNGYWNGTSGGYIENVSGNLNLMASSLAVVFGMNGGEYGRFASGGNFGIGTTSPYAKLSVVGPVVAESFIATSTTATSTFAGDLNVASGALTVSRATGVTDIGSLNLGNLAFEADSGVVSWVDMPVTSSAVATTAESYTAHIDGNPLLTIYGESDGAGSILNNYAVGIGSSTPWAKLSVQGTAGSPRPIFDVASSSNDVYFRVNPDGNVGVGTTSPWAKLSIGGLLAASNLAMTSTSSVSTFAGAVGIGTTSPWRTFSASGTVSLFGLPAEASSQSALCVTAAGDVQVNTGAQTCTVSSARYKHDIAPLTDQSGLALVRALRPVSYRYNADENAHIGFIAEEVGVIEPRLIAVGADGLPRSVRYEEMTAALAKAIQELDQRVGAGGGGGVTMVNGGSATPHAIIEALANFAITIEQGIIRAARGVFGVLEVTDGIEMRDRVTGETYCTRIANGDWEKTLGTCVTPAPPQMQAAEPQPDESASTTEEAIPTEEQGEPTATSSDPVSSSTPPVP